MRINHKHISLIIIVTFLITISGSILTGYWATESSKVPQLITSGEFAGSYDPSDIRGSYSFKDVSQNFNVPIEILKEAFMIPDSYDIAAFQNKELESLYTMPGPAEIGNGSVKLFVALYTGLPYDYESSGDYIPVSAYRILVENNRLSAAQDNYLANYLVDLEMLNTQIDTTTQESTETSDSERSIKGKTLFQDVLTWGVTQKEIENVLGIPMGHPLDEIRTYCQSQDIEFQAVKTDIQILLNEK